MPQDITTDLSRHDADLSWSVDPQDVARTVAALVEQADRVANYVQSLPTREDYDALVLENNYLRENVRALTLIADRQNKSIRDLCTAIQVVKDRTEPLDLPQQMERVGRLLVDIRAGGLKS